MSIKNTSSALTRAAADKLFTATEANKLAGTIIKDLAATSDPVGTMKVAAENLRKFLEPFRGNAQPASGVRMEQDAQYKLADLANALERAGKDLDKVKGGAFAMALGLAMDDGAVQPAEAGQLRKLAEKMVADSAKPAETAGVLRDVLVQLESTLGMSSTFGRGPTRDEVLPGATSKRMDALSRFLGAAIAQHAGTATGGGVKADSDFAKGMKEVTSNRGGGFGAGMELMMLPSLVDSELGKFDSEGFSGTAKMKLDTQATARGAELLKYVDGLPGDNDDIKERLFRLVTGRFCPPAMEAELATQLAGTDTAELKDVAERMKQQAGELKDTRSFSVKRERSALMEGVALVEGELAKRAGAAGLLTLDSPARRTAVMDLLKADPNVAPLLADGGKLDESKMTFFTWDQAKVAVKADFAPNVDLDNVLMNMAGAANMLRATATEGHAFVRIPLAVRGEPQPFPLTVILKRDGSDWSPVRVADGGIPFEN